MCVCVFVVELSYICIILATTVPHPPPPFLFSRFHVICVDFSLLSEGLDLFRNFLRSEFSEENIEFWIACEDYKTAKSGRLTSKAQQIYSDFVAVQAPREVGTLRCCAFSSIFDLRGGSFIKNILSIVYH